MKKLTHKQKAKAERQADLLRAHQLCPNGVNLKAQRSLNKGYSDTPLFFQDNQTKLF